MGVFTYLPSVVTSASVAVFEASSIVETTCTRKKKNGNTLNRETDREGEREGGRHGTLLTATKILD